MTDLPSGWARAPVTDFVSVHDSRRVPLNAKQREAMRGEYPYYGANGLVDHVNDYLFDGEYTLLAEDGGYFDHPKRGVAYEVSGKFWVNNHAHILQPLAGIPNRFLRHALNAFDWMPFVGGSTRLKLTQGGLQQAQVALPPLPEQRRIVAKVDGLSTKSERVREQLDHIPRLAKKYKQAILAAAFRGDLTREYQGDRPRSQWNSRQLADICDSTRPITYGVIKLGPEMANGVPCLRTSNVRWLRVDIDGLKKISLTLSSEYSRTILRGGEVLVNVRGTLGGVAVAMPSMVGWNVSREVAVVPVDTTILEARYLMFWIGADASQQWLTRVEKGVAYTGINIEDLRKLPVEFPWLDEQREIIRRIEVAFAWIDRLANEATTARKLIDHLDQVILAKAFQGELVPQDPNDEPASILLERIRAERVLAVAPTRTTSKRKHGL
jgi:type I restriction enzyme S subunit